MYINLDEFRMYFDNEYVKDKLFKYFPKMNTQQIRDAILKDDITRK